MSSFSQIYLVNIRSAQRYLLKDRIVTIGSARDSTISIDATCPDYVAHCLFKNGTYSIQPLTEEYPICINDKKIIGKYELKSGDVLNIGKLITLRFEETGGIEDANNRSVDKAGELIDLVVLILKNRDGDIPTLLMTAISRLFRCDAARIVTEESESNKRQTLIRFPVHAGLERFSDRAIDWAKESSKTVLMFETDWKNTTSDKQSLEKNSISSILCAPLGTIDNLKGFLYLDKIGKNNNFTESDRIFCDTLMPLFKELLINSEERKRQLEVIAALQQLKDVDNNYIVYRSEKMHSILSLINRIAPTDSPVLLLGETGTGKEVLAREVHRKSRRANAPFKAVNCGALPENLIESELFGHEKGAFTGAQSRKTGLFESAHGGTVFLDEIGEMPLSLQVKLLRVLQESEVMRIGATDTIKVDVRIIAATNRNLKEEVENGRFRSDLFFRLNVLSVNIPSLRERSDDILLLAEFFIEKYCSRVGKAKLILSNDAREVLLKHLWPGNIRELENTIQKAVILSTSNKICKQDIDIESNTISENQDSQIPTIRSARESAEKDVIQSALRATVGNISQTARILEIDRKWLFTKMTEYGIDAEVYRKSGEK